MIYAVKAAPLYQQYHFIPRIKSCAIEFSGKSEKEDQTDGQDKVIKTLCFFKEIQVWVHVKLQ